MFIKVLVCIINTYIRGKILNTFKEVNLSMTLTKEREALIFLKDAFNDEEDYIYVLDTNALLQFFQFDNESLLIIENELKKKNYFGTRQIEVEFLRNKDFNSNYFLIDMNKKMSSDYEISVSQSLRNYMMKYSHILSNEKEIQKKIRRYSTSTKTIGKEIEKIEKLFTEIKAKELVDKSIDMISNNINFDTKLDDKIYDKLKLEYDDLLSKYREFKSKKIDLNNEFRTYVFPGMGEKKVSNPEGDYFIFHELLKLALNQKKNIIFLTNDTTKSDWLDSKTGRNYNHYISIFHSITKQAIRIENFNSFINTQLGIKTEKLLDIEDYDYDDGFIGQYLMKWSQFERYIREWSINNGYKPNTNLKQLMYHANSNGKITETIFQQFLPLNEMRNNLVHGYYFKYQSLPENEKELILNNLEDFIELFTSQI